MRNPLPCSAAIVLALGLPSLAADRPDKVIADFESETYAPWTTTGEAFGPRPAKGALPGQMAVGDYRGERLVNSFFHGDDTEGTLTSPEFPIERKYMRFLVGGGRAPGELSVNLIVGGKVVRTTTGSDSEFLRPRSWDVGEFAGKAAKVEIVDRRKGGWGHINVDEIVLADTVPPPPDDRAEALARAEASVLAATARAAADPLRPTYHFLPPSNWMNDPNGPIQYKGYYHLFYQHNPYGDGWGNMHWGHARSKDLAHWEHLPIALWPSKGEGEDHVFSGSATLGPDGKPMLFYTSIGPRNPEQWAAVPDGDDLIQWKKHPANPILTEELHKGDKIYDWRDPYVFHAGGKTYLVAGGHFGGDKPIVAVYRAEDAGLTKWTYLGVLFQHPDAEVKNIECPLFFPVGDKWVLIVSQGRPVQWFVGSLDKETMKFHPEHRGIADAGNFYAPNVMADEQGRTLLWGWIPDFPAARGWNGCMTLPRVLGISPDGNLTSSPAPELAKLRGPAMVCPADRILKDQTVDLPGIRGDTLELQARVMPSPRGAAGFKLRVSKDGMRSVVVEYDGKTLDVAGAKVVAPTPPGEKGLGLRIFLDRSVLEVYTSTGVAVSRVIAADPADVGVEAFARGGSAGFSSHEAWPMGSIWKKAD